MTHQIKATLELPEGSFEAEFFQALENQDILEKQRLNVSQARQNALLAIKAYHTAIRQYEKTKNEVGAKNDLKGTTLKIKLTKPGLARQLDKSDWNDLGNSVFSYKGDLRRAAVLGELATKGVFRDTHYTVVETPHEQAIKLI